MQTVILGAGSLGSVIGAYLARAGFDVTLIARSGHADAIQRDGLHVTGLADFTVHPRATADPSQVTEAELLLVTVKTKDTLPALESARHIKVGVAASLQNGVVKNEQLASVFGRDRVIGATTIVGASLVRPGVVAHTADGYTFFGELAGGTSERVQRVVGMFSKAGLKVQGTDNIVSAEWAKLCQMCPAAIVSALTRLEYYKVCKGPDTAHLFVTLTKECAKVAVACGATLADYPGFNVKTLVDAPFEQAVQIIIRRGEMLEQRGMTSVRISTLQDVLAGKKTEIEEIAGYIVQQASEKNVAVPAVEFGYRAIRGIDAWL